MTPGLCLDSGEFIPAAELNRMIEMTPAKITQMQQEGEVFWYSHHQMEVLQKRIAELEAKELALHGQLAESMLNASTGWSRYEMANRLSNSLQSQLASGQEPVACRWSESSGKRWFSWTTDWTNYDQAKSMGCMIEFAHPAPAQQPLSDERICDIARLQCHISFDHESEVDAAITLARAIEAEHGINEKP